MTDRSSDGPLRDLFRRRGGRVAALETPDADARQREKLRSSVGDTLALKQALQERLLDEIDRQAAGGETEERVVEFARQFIEDVLVSEELPLNERERRRLADELVDETVGLGPLAPLMSDPAVSDILVNRPDQVFIERFGRLEETDVRFRDENHILRVIERIAARVGRRIDPAHPMVDLRLPDGSRVNATVPPASPDGPTLSIRRFGRRRLRREDLLRLGSISEEMVEVLDAVVRGRRNILVSGGTGAGKSTLLGALAEAIPATERIVTIEDTLELILDQRHWVRMETRPPNVEGRGEVTARGLVINSLRMRPDRIIVGEVRGPEALDMLQAMNTGHDGSLCTLHANSPRDALARLETMVLMAGLELPSRAIREQMVSAVDLIVHVRRFEDGVRRVESVTEVVGMEGSTALLEELFRFERQDVADGRVRGRFVATGIVPRFWPELARRGIELSTDVFRKDKTHRG